MHTHTPTNPSYPLFPFCGLMLKFTVVSVVDESELVVPSLSSDPKNVERLLERPSYQDYQRLGLGNLSSVGQRSRTEPFRLTTVNSTYSVCRRWENCDCFCFLRTCFNAQVCYISPTVMNPCFSAQVLYIPTVINPCFSAQVCYISLQLWILALVHRYVTYPELLWILALVHRYVIYPYNYESLL